MIKGCVGASMAARLRMCERQNYSRPRWRASNWREIARRPEPQEASAVRAHQVEPPRIRLHHKRQGHYRCGGKKERRACGKKAARRQGALRHAAMEVLQHQFLTPTITAARERIAKFVASARKTVRTQVAPQVEITLSVLNPDQYRGAIIELESS